MILRIIQIKSISWFKLEFSINFSKKMAQKLKILFGSKFMRLTLIVGFLYCLMFKLKKEPLNLWIFTSWYKGANKVNSGKSSSSWIKNAKHILRPLIYLSQKLIKRSRGGRVGFPSLGSIRMIIYLLKCTNFYHRYSQELLESVFLIRQLIKSGALVSLRIRNFTAWLRVKWFREKFRDLRGNFSRIIFGWAIQSLASKEAIYTVQASFGVETTQENTKFLKRGLSTTINALKNFRSNRF